MSKKSWPSLYSNLYYIKWGKTSWAYSAMSRCLQLLYCLPKSSDPFYIVTYYIKWVTTSWTDSMLCPSSLGSVCIVTYTIKKETKASWSATANSILIIWKWARLLGHTVPCPDVCYCVSRKEWPILYSDYIKWATTSWTHSTTVRARENMSVGVNLLWAPAHLPAPLQSNIYLAPVHTALSHTFSLSLAPSVCVHIVKNMKFRPLRRT